MSQPPSNANTIRFEDGAAYERFMGVWSDLAGKSFLDWLAPARGLDWLDVGCGNGAFTATLAARSAPRSLHGVDPSRPQLAFARKRPLAVPATYSQADARALPFAADAFDAAVMPLVLFFVPEPAKGVAEMVRVVRPGGSISAYVWDLPGGGFPYELLHQELRAMGQKVPMPPCPDVARLAALEEHWRAAGLEDVSLTSIDVRRTYRDFDEYWSIVQGGPSAAALLAAMTPEVRRGLQARLRAGLDIAADGSVRVAARAHAVRGRKPKPR